MVKLRWIIRIPDLRKQGLWISAISSKAGLNRRTVRKYLDRVLNASVYGPWPPRPGNLAPYEGLSRRRLQRERRRIW